MLAARQVDLVSYERVVADMIKRYREGLLSPFSGAQTLSIVGALRDAVRVECEHLQAQVAALEDACKKLEPEAVSP